MHYYLYEIKNTINGKIYVGVHKTKSLDDGYMGSGKVVSNAIRKYGIEHFTKTILETFDNLADMFAREKEIVNDEFLARQDVYNLRRGGSGGFDFINKAGLNWSVEKNRSISPFNTDEWKARQVNEGWRERGGAKQGGWNKGLPSLFDAHSDKSKKKISDSRRGKGIANQNRAISITDKFGNSFESLKSCAIHYGVSDETVRRWRKQNKL
jgi:group I intron endonuclease